MTKRNQKLFCGMIVSGAIFGLFLYGCGGGGGDESGSDTPSAYTGETSQVKITNQNAVAVATDSLKNTYGSSKLSSTFSDLPMIGMVSGEAGGMSAGSVAVLMSKLVFKLAKNQNAGETDALYLGATASVSDSIDGSCGGKLNFEGQMTKDGLKRTADFNINGIDYCEDGMTMNGQMKVDLTGTCHDENCDSMTMGMDLTFEDLTYSSSDISAIITGSVASSVEVSGETMELQMSIDLVMQDKGAGKSYWFDAVDVRIADNGFGIETITMEGRFYDHDYGYIDMNTPKPFKIDSNENKPPSEGILIVEGEKGDAGGRTKARLTCLDQYTYRVEADTNGDGTYDYNSGTRDWISP